MSLYPSEAGNWPCERQLGARSGVVTSMNDERPILEVRQSAWNMSSIRDQRLRIFGDRVEFVHPRVMSEAREIVIPLADIDFISVKRYLLVWSDLLIVAENGAAIRLRPLVQSDAEHAEDVIKRQSKKVEA
jgi:hypothetical protein